MTQEGQKSRIAEPFLMASETAGHIKMATPCRAKRRTAKRCN